MEAQENPGCLPPFRVKVDITFADGTPVQEALNTFFQFVAPETNSQVIVLRSLAHMLKQTMPALPAGRLQDAMALFQKLRALQTLARTGLCDMVARPDEERSEPKKELVQRRSKTESDLPDPDLNEDVGHHFRRATSDESTDAFTSLRRPEAHDFAAGGLQGPHAGTEGNQAAAIAELYRSNREKLKFSSKPAAGLEAPADLKNRRMSVRSSTVGSMPTISELPELHGRTGTNSTEESWSDTSSCRGSDTGDDTLTPETDGSEFAQVPDDDVVLPEAPTCAGVVKATPARKDLHLHQAL